MVTSPYNVLFKIEKNAPFFYEKPRAKEKGATRQIIDICSVVFVEVRELGAHLGGWGVAINCQIR